MPPKAAPAPPPRPQIPPQTRTGAEIMNDMKKNPYAVWNGGRRRTYRRKSNKNKSRKNRRTSYRR